jgi:hypothetical protein
MTNLQRFAASERLQGSFYVEASISFFFGAFHRSPEIETCDKITQFSSPKILLVLSREWMGMGEWDYY